MKLYPLAEECQADHSFFFATQQMASGFAKRMEAASPSRAIPWSTGSSTIRWPGPPWLLGTEGAMPESTSDKPGSAKSAEDQLNSWKEVAAHFSRDVTTVQRWEKREGMPVHRHVHDKIGSVYAFRHELQSWAQSRNLKADGESSSETAASDPVLAPQVALPQPSKERRFPLARAIVMAAMAAVLAVGATLYFRKTGYFWHNPLESARFERVTDFDGVARDAALSRDGHFVAFLSDHDGQMDVWISQIGSGQFHNLTRGTEAEIVNPSIRTLGFSADSSLVTFWARKQGGSKNNSISIWAVPTLGGQPKPYLEGAAEFDWSHDGAQLAYHTTGPGDPLFVSDGMKRSDTSPIFTAPPGLHSHFPLWSPDGAFIYFVQGSLPDKLDIWRIPKSGGTAERVTSHFGNVTYPVLLDDRTLIYLATDPDGSGPWIYGMDPSRRIAHRLTPGPERYTSLAASADGRRVVATLATPKRTLWRLTLANGTPETSMPKLLTLTTSAGFSPRFGSNCLLYVSSTSDGDSIWKYQDGNGTELWSNQGARILAAPVVSADGASIAFSVRQNSQSRIYVMQSDGSNAHSVADSIDLRGAPAWAHDGRSITSAVNTGGVPRLANLAYGHRAPLPFVREYSVDPVWSPDGRFVVYSGADIGTRFSIRAAKPDGTHYQMPNVTLTRGSRHVVFASGGHALVFLRGEIQHKDLWAVDLRTGAERQITRLPADFDVRDFDLSPDGHDVVLERLQERSDVVLMELAHR